MNKILDLLKFDILLNKKRNNTAKNKIGNILMFVIGCVIVFALAFLVSFAISFVGGVGNNVGCLSFVLTIVQVILLFYSLSSLMKSLFNNNDKHLLAYLPLAKWQIYLARAIGCFINIYLIAIVTIVPTMIAFGIVFEMSYTFYLMILPVLIFLPLIPFALASLVLVPTMFVQNWLKNKAILKLTVSILLTIVLFYFYSKFIFKAADVVLLENMGSNNILRKVVEVFKSPWLASTWLSSAVLFENLLWASLLTIGVSVILIIVSFALGAITYKNVFTTNLLEKNVSKKIKTKTQKRNSFMAYFVMEFKDLFRSATYSYTYFGMAIAMPIMVWFCNNFILEFATQKVGSSIVFGTTLLVVLIFCSIICSPMASLISKEGDKFWILKTNPRGIKTPLLAKCMVGIVVSVSALIVTFIMLVAFKQITILQALTILLIAFIYEIGLVLMGLVINLLKPNIFFNRKENNSNMITHLLIGFILSCAIGIGAIVLTYSHQFWVVAVMAIGASAVFMLINLVLLITQNTKVYSKIEL